MQTEKSQPEGKRIIPETRFTGLTTLSVDPRIEISQSASETDVWLYFLPITSVGNRTEKSQSIIGRVKPIDY